MADKNVILIMTDQMRGDCLSCDGHPVVETPNLDEMAGQGTHFKHAYTACPSCLPARATLMTGMNQWHTGILGMGRGQGPIPNDFPHTLAGEMTAAGYQTHLVGKGHFHPQRAMMGFQTHELDESNRMAINGMEDEYRSWFKEQTAGKDISPDDHGVAWNSWMSRPWHTEEYLHPTSWTMNRSIDFLQRRDLDKSFFLNISFARPHSPYVPPAPYIDMYKDAEIPDPFIAEWSAMHDDEETASNVEAWRGIKTPAQIRRARMGYYGSISFIDTQIGRLRNWMKRFQPETLHNTMFIFTSDHGDMQGDHNLWRKTYAYEGSARIPFIIQTPTDYPGSRHLADEVVELQDIMPTILDFAGVDIPSTVDGRSLLSLTEKKDNNWRSYVHGEHCTCYSRDQEMQYVTDGRKKFIWLPRLGMEQFFDLEDDPGECQDLAGIPSMKTEIDLWRGYLIKVLEERDCGWVKDGQLCCPQDVDLVSPWKEQRYNGTGS